MNKYDSVLPIGRVPRNEFRDYSLPETNPDSHHRRRHSRRQRTPRGYFKTLKKASDASNDMLRDRKSPYRFDVVRRGGEVFIEVLKLDEDENRALVYRKNISDDDFNRWIEDVGAIEGLIIDRTV